MFQIKKLEQNDPIWSQPAQGCQRFKWTPPFSKNPIFKESLLNIKKKFEKKRIIYHIHPRIRQIFLHIIQINGTIQTIDIANCSCVPLDQRNAFSQQFNR